MWPVVLSFVYLISQRAILVKMCKFMTLKITCMIFWIQLDLEMTFLGNLSKQLQFDSPHAVPLCVVLYGGGLHHCSRRRVSPLATRKTRGLHRCRLPGVVSDRPVEHHAGRVHIWKELEADAIMGYMVKTPSKSSWSCINRITSEDRSFGVFLPGYGMTLECSATT